MPLRTKPGNLHSGDPSRTLSRLQHTDYNLDKAAVINCSSVAPYRVINLDWVEWTWEDAKQTLIRPQRSEGLVLVLKNQDQDFKGQDQDQYQDLWSQDQDQDQDFCSQDQDQD